MRARFSASASRPEMVSMGQRYRGAPFQSSHFRTWRRSASAPPPRAPCAAARYAAPWCARFSAAMSSLPILSIACMARCALALSLSPSMSVLSLRNGIARQRREQLSEALEAAGPSLLVPVARRNRCKDSLMERHLGASVALGKRDGHECFRTGGAAGIDPGVREYQALRRHDLAIHAAQPVLAA